MREMVWLDAVHFVIVGWGRGVVHYVSAPEEGSPVGVCSSSSCVRDKPLESGDDITIRMYNV